MRLRYREFLGRCAAYKVRNPRRDQEAADFVKSAAEPLKRVWTLASARLISGSATLQYHTIILDVTAFDAFVRSLILDAKYAIGVDLCHCGLNRCSKFFLAVKPKTGRPKRKYCCADHMEEYNKLGGAERTRRARSGKHVRKIK
jgi:hypothetical protein